MLACILFAVCLSKHQQSCCCELVTVLQHIANHIKSLALTIAHTLAASDAGRAKQDSPHLSSDAAVSQLPAAELTPAASDAGAVMQPSPRRRPPSPSLRCQWFK